MPRAKWIGLLGEACYPESSQSALSVKLAQTVPPTYYLAPHRASLAQW